MSVNLCIDCGNTNIKAAIFVDNSLKKSMIIPDEIFVKEINGLIDQFKPQKAILSSVTGENDAMIKFLKEKFKDLVVLEGNTNVPINNAYSSPETLGPDRLALITAAYILNPDKNNLVISIGSCITYNFIQKTKTFRGGAISPGLYIRLRSLHEFTGMLPMVDIDGDAQLVGYDTETCIRSGVVFGMAAEIDGIIAQYEEKYPDFNAILTGGDAPYFADKLKSKIFADPDLLYKGLNIILNHNVPFPL